MSDDIVARLRKEIRKRDREYPVELLPELREAADEIERLRAERDEARRWICEQKAAMSDRDASWWAGIHTWDCFKEVKHD
jgi:hypothetical protein